MSFRLLRFPLEMPCLPVRGGRRLLPWKKSVLKRSSACFSSVFLLFFLFWLWLKRQLLDLVTAERQQKMLLNLTRASFSREEAVALPELFCSIILGCCYSSLACRSPRVYYRLRCSWD